MDRETLLLDAVQNLVDTYEDRCDAALVLDALARAKIHIRDGFSVLALDVPPADEYVTLVVGLATQELELRFKESE